NNLSDLRYQARASLTRGLIKVRIYGITRGELVEVVTEPADERREVPPEALNQIKNNTSFSTLSELADHRVLVDAYAPIVTSKDGLVGIVAVEFVPPPPTTLQQLRRDTY